MSRPFKSAFAFVLIFSSCALLNPNPNREKDLEEFSTTLKPFTTDYCSKWPDGNREDPKKWADCCFTHDLHYWLGGTQDERRGADKLLKSCLKIHGDSLTGFLMYMGVRFGGLPGEASFSWGYGWTKNREYSPVKKDDLDYAKELLLEFSSSRNDKEKNLIQDFINQKIIQKKIGFQKTGSLSFIPLN